MPQKASGAAAKQRKFRRPQASLTVKAVLKALRDHAGIRSHAAEALKVSKSAITRFIQRHPELEDALQEIEDDMNDTAESGLFKAIQGGDLRAITFRLERKAKNRGYGRGMEVTGKGGGPIEYRDLSHLTDEQLNTLERAAAALAGGNESAGDPTEPLSGKHQG